MRRNLVFSEVEVATGAALARSGAVFETSAGAASVDASASMAKNTMKYRFVIDRNVFKEAAPA